MAKKLAVLLFAFLVFPVFLFAQTCDTARTDMNCDGILDNSDWINLNHMYFNGSLGCRSTDPNGGDLNCDGLKDATDLVALLKCINGLPVSDSCPPDNVRPLTPDPRDSIIIESMSKLSGADNGVPADTSSYLYWRVWITNKDSLANVNLPLVETSLSGGAYAVLAYPRTFSGIIDKKTTTLQYLSGVYLVSSGSYVYNGISPDTFVFPVYADPLDSSDVEPPNTTRKYLFDFKFDTVRSVADCNGQVELDSTKTLPTNTVQFVDVHSRRVPVNFVKGVMAINPRGDFNLDGQLTPEDLISILSCVFLEADACNPSCRSDVNCDGSVSPTDVVVQLLAVFQGMPICSS